MCRSHQSVAVLLGRSWVCAWIKHGHSNCRLPMDGGGGTPRPVLLTGAKKSGVPDYLRATVWAFRISLSVIKFTLKKNCLTGTVTEYCLILRLLQAGTTASLWVIASGCDLLWALVRSFLLWGGKYQVPVIWYWGLPRPLRARSFISVLCCRVYKL